MSWPERRSGPSSPEYYSDAADPDEAQLHADAAQWHYLLEIAGHADTSQQGAEFRTQASQLAAKWSRHPSLVRQHQWIRQRDAFALWRDHPDKAARDLRDLERAHVAGGEGVDEFGLRCLRQAGEQTGRLERGITGSEQDSARWQPLTRAPGTTAEANTDRGTGTTAGELPESTPSPPNVLDRALGIPQSLLNLDEVGAVIAGIDRALDNTEELGTSDDEVSAATAEHERTAPEVTAPTARQQRDALQALQDLYAEHTRTVEATNDLAADSVKYNLTKVAALEQISAKYRSARVAAALAGAPTEVIKSVSAAGQGGTYWRDGPGDPRVDPTAIGQTDVDHTPDRHDGPGAPDPPAFATNASNSGVAIGQAVDAASAAAEHGDWQSPESAEVSRSSPPQEVVKGVDL
ncbi:hypothetical protein [Nocardia brasiliensis]|uniref:hypothetical protein n=1 Tax=Nocardia brasiliensis TaxID=37326 RepID=UPI0024569FAC|nr:hypothetical protein [Nocardia brasiliensis]